MLCDANGVYRGGITAGDNIGEFVQLSDAARRQMINMILDGHFGEAKDAFIDENRYWRIRDDLITWPTQRTIAGEMLRVLDLRRNKNSQ